ncbi:hypothetical protein ABZX40_14860 [Streptomyces sp. NPDC004610]
MAFDRRLIAPMLLGSVLLLPCTTAAEHSLGSLTPMSSRPPRKV